jgi:murein DD-endopeptidase MepM/ murein hydrolase activator NlpD
MSRARGAAMLAALALAAACTKGPLSRLSRPPSPHEAYVASLRTAGLDQTALGRDWLAAADRALTQPVIAPAPFRETGYFPPEQASAVGYRMSLRRGRVLDIDARFESLGSGRLFVDLFRLDPGDAPERISSLGADATQLRVEIDADADYVLRVQPELLRGGRYELTRRTLASLPFPIPEITVRAVQSGFGAERDAGVRQHEGVDIFARAGTPVAAVTAGVAQPSTNNLGGNVVWLQDPARGRTFYYAHLQRAALDRTTLVRSGDILGFVGNTGNARTTAPHLHFGIYARGAIDPLPFIAEDDDTPPPPAVDLRLGTLARIRAARSPLRAGAAGDAPTATTLTRGTVVTLLGAAGGSWRVQLPEQSIGYVARQALSAADAPLSRRTLAAGLQVREQPSESAPAVHVLPEPAQVEVFGTFGGFELVRSPRAIGWVPRQS